MGKAGASMVRNAPREAGTAEKPRVARGDDLMSSYHCDHPQLDMQDAPWSECFAQEFGWLCFSPVHWKSNLLKAASVMSTAF